MMTHKPMSRGAGKISGTVQVMRSVLRWVAVGVVVSILVGCTKHNPSKCCTTAEECDAAGLDKMYGCTDGLVCYMLECVSADTALTVNMPGKGVGTVMSDPSGLTCSSGTCTGNFPAGAVVTLTASATTGIFLGWSGACSGRDLCTVVMDGDRSLGAAFGFPGDAIWAGQLSGPESDESGAGIAMDSDGNLIVVGTFKNEIAPVPATPSTTLTSNGSSYYDAFIYKISAASGDVLWGKSLGSSLGDHVTSVAVDSSNNIYVAGEIGGPVDFGGGVVTPILHDAFVLKLASDGSYLWDRVFSGSGSEGVFRISVSENSAVVIGHAPETMTVDGTTYTSAGNQDIFVASLSVNGATQWFKMFGSSSLDVARAVAIDIYGNVIVTGEFYGSISFGGPTLNPSGSTDGFIAKLAGSNGAHQLSLRVGGPMGDYVSAVDTDADNNIIVAGGFSGAADFGCPIQITPFGYYDVYVAKYSQAGACLWVKQFGGTSVMNLEALGISLSANGDIALAGNFCGALSLGGAMVSSAGSCPDTDVFATRLDGNGGHLSSTRVGGTGTETAGDVTQSPDGRFFIVGRFSGFAEFGPNVFTSAGTSDVFVLALYPL